MKCGYLLILALVGSGCSNVHVFDRPVDTRSVSAAEKQAAASPGLPQPTSVTVLSKPEPEPSLSPTEPATTTPLVSKSVAASEANNLSAEKMLHEKRQKEAPMITSVTRVNPKNGDGGLVIEGSGFDRGAKVYIFPAKGSKPTGHLEKSTFSTNKINVKNSSLKSLKPGKYIIKIKNSAGNFSNAAQLIIEKDKQQQTATSPFVYVPGTDKKPEAVYFLGGNMLELFKRYTAEHEKRINLKIEIRFYEKKGSLLAIRKVKLEDLGDYLADSPPENFINKIRGLGLSNAMAEMIDEASLVKLIAHAKEEKVDIYYKRN